MSRYDHDVEIAFHHFVDLDSRPDVVDAIVGTPVAPSTILITGVVPAVRARAYWQLSDPCLDMKEWHDGQQQLAAALGGDPVVVNPSRIMRLPGTVSYSAQNKLARGYVAEMTAHATLGDPVERSQLLAAYPVAQPSKAIQQPPTAATVAGDRTITIEDIESMLAVVGGEDDRETWLNVGRAIHHGLGGDPQGLTAWEQWSSASPKFVRGECGKLWRSFKASGITIGTLVYLAKAADPSWVSPPYRVKAKEHAPVRSNDGMVICNLPKGFQMREDGLYYLPPPDPQTKEPSEPVKLCQRFSIVGRTTDERGENPGILIEWTDEQGRQHDWIVPGAILYSDRGKISEELGSRNPRCELGAGAYGPLKWFFNGPRCDRNITTYDRAGWQRDDLFLLPNGDGFGADAGNSTFSAKNPKVFQTSGTLKGWQDNVAKACIGNSRLVFAASAAFAGPLIERAGNEFLAFHFVGPSSLGKSTALAVAGSVWGRPDARDQIKQ